MAIRTKLMANADRICFGSTVAVQVRYEADPVLREILRFFGRGDLRC